MRNRVRGEDGSIFLGFVSRIEGNIYLVPALAVISMFAAFGLVPSSTRAQELLVLSAHEMCADAEAIVSGERVGVNEVRVHRWILKPSDAATDGRNIMIAGLEKHHRMVGARNPPAGQDRPAGRLTSQRLLCFLERKGNDWRVMAAAPEGSSGLVWIEEGRCYRYEQRGGPDSCVLLPSLDYRTEGELLAAVEEGLADRSEWEAVREIAHPEEQAIVLCSYLLERTSPEGRHGTYRKRIRRVLPKLGKQAVKELLVLLREAAPGDNLNDAVLVLHDLGPSAVVAVPELVTLLERPGAADPQPIIEALGRIGDATVAPRLLPFLTNELRIRAAVAGAMARFAYQDAAPLIIKALPGIAALPGAREREDAYHVYIMLQALHELKAGEVSLLTQDYLKAPAMQPLRNLLEPFLEHPNP